MKFWTTSLLAGLLALPAMAQTEPQVIYGEDDRKDLFDPSNTELELKLATATAALTYSSSLTVDETDSNYFKLPTATYGEAYGLCEDEPFGSQPNPAFCSGFLVAPNVLVTAGHCIETEMDCSSVSFMFGFGYHTDTTDLSRIAKADVYTCKRIMARELAGGRGSDFAVVELDREVTGREPLQFRSEGTIENGTNLVVIGHPAGIPTKIAAGAAVRDNVPADYFVANLDTFGGNSGSAVMDAATGVVEGILVRGETDFEMQDGCRVAYKCTDLGCRGEDVTKATVFAPFVTGDTPDPDRPTETYTFEAADLNVTIPDNNLEGISQAIQVDQAGEIADIGVHVRIQHTYVGDLSVTLVHPDGTSVALHSRGNGSDEGLDRVYGLDGIAVSGLVRLRDKPLQGTWLLKVVDEAAEDTGVLQYVKLTAKVYTADDNDDEDSDENADGDQ